MSDSSQPLSRIPQDTVLADSRWPEPVRVLRLDQIDEDLFKLYAVGLNTEQLYSSILKRDEVESLSHQIQTGASFDGSAEQFRLAAEAHRIRLAHLHDPLFAVSVSKIDPLPHQLEAVYEYMLPQPALRFMLADDPGAGKTIMAGLLLKELKLRGAVVRTLIIVPSPLRLQWKREMWEKFAEHFDLVDRGTLSGLGGARTWRVTSQAIVSIDFAKQPDVLDSLAVSDPWDLVIVDESHKMSAYRRSPTKVERSQRYRLGEVLSERAERLLMMTATPHKGDPENFRFLLSLVDPDLFADEEILRRAVQRHENPLFLRRLKEDMRHFDGRPLFPPRHAQTVAYQLAGLEWDLYEKVTRYVEVNFNRALSEENRNVTFALIILQRRLASSIRAIRRSLENRQQRLIDLRNDVLRDPELLEEARRERLDVPDDDEDLPEDERWDIEQRNDGYWRIRHVPAELRNLPPELVQAYGQPAEQYLTFTFDLEDSRRTGVEFVGPGQALFEAVMHHTLTRFHETLERGVVFVDPDAEREGLIWLIEGTVVDGQGATIGQQLFALYQPANGGEIEPLHPSMFLDYEAPPEALAPPGHVTRLMEARGTVVGWSIRNMLEPYRQQIAERRIREVAIVERYLRESFDVLIARSDGMLMDYEHKQAGGKDMRVKIAEEERRNADLRLRKDERLARAEREKVVSLAEPRILGVAAILPHLEGRAGGRGSASMFRDDDVERAAIAFVLAYETDQGRDAEDLSAQKLPYDIVSRDADGEIRYIEVKGRAGVGEVELSEREWLTAENLGESYWLYAVMTAITNPRLHILRDPVHNLRADSVVKHMRYRVTPSNWPDAHNNG